MTHTQTPQDAGKEQEHLQGAELEELVAEILGPPWRGRVARARQLLDRFGLCELSRADPAVLEAAAGLTARQALRLWSAFAVGRRVERERIPAGQSLRRPESVHRLLAPEVRGRLRETFHLLALDAKHRLKLHCQVSEGTLTTSLVHPREVFRPAIQVAAAAVIVAHHHPSGDPEPSAEDLEVTRRLVLAGRTLGLPLLDHVVLGSGRWVSLRERVDFEAVS